MGKRNKGWGSPGEKLSVGTNVNSFIKYRDQLMELGMVMFDWDFSSIEKNLRTNINPAYIERTEYFKGATIFFKDDVLGYLCLPVILGGPFSEDDKPKRRTAYSKSGYRKELNEDNSVIIYNSYLKKPSCYTVDFYARQLSDLEESIMVNCKAQKTPVAILCPENERLTMKNLYLQYDGNMPFIFGQNDLNLGQIKAISTGAPFVADKLYQIKMQLWNEALTHLGISNVSYQKKERLVSDEVIRNMGGTIASRYSRLDMRRQAVEEINDKFGLNISVDYRDDFRQTDDENMIGDDTSNNPNKPVAMVEDLRTR